MTIARRPLLVLALLAFACSEESAAAPATAAPAGPTYEPKLSQELVPPAAKGLVLGVATEKDVTAAFGAGTILEDKSLGGTAKVEYGEKPAIQIALPAKDDVVSGEAWLLPDAGGERKLARLSLVVKSTGNCEWITANVGKHDAAKRRPGSNRVFGKKGDYTAGSVDGTMPVGIECNPSTRDGVAVESIDYSLEPGGKRSMLVNPNP